MGGPEPDSWLQPVGNSEGGFDSSKTCGVRYMAPHRADTLKYGPQIDTVCLDDGSPRSCSRVVFTLLIDRLGLATLCSVHSAEAAIAWLRVCLGTAQGQKEHFQKVTYRPSLNVLRLCNDRSSRVSWVLTSNMRMTCLSWISHVDGLPKTRLAWQLARPQTFWKLLLKSRSWAKFPP